MIGTVYWLSMPIDFIGSAFLSKCSADEIAPTYARLVSELQRGDYKLLDTWKKQQYQKAISILQE